MRRLLILALFAAACADAPQTPTTPLEGVARQALSCPVGTLSWSVLEAGGGTVDQAGNYTAPPCRPDFADATYTVRVTGCGRTVDIPITVADSVTSLAIWCGVLPGETCCRPPPWTVEPGAQIRMFARITYSCAGHVVYTSQPPPFCP